MQGSRYRLVWIRQVDDVLQWRLVGTGKALMKPDVFELFPALTVILLYQRGMNRFAAEMMLQSSPPQAEWESGAARVSTAFPEDRVRRSPEE